MTRAEGQRAQPDSWTDRNSAAAESASARFTDSFSPRLHVDRAFAGRIVFVVLLVMHLREPMLLIA